VCLCYSHAAGELIRLSVRLSLHFGLAVNLRVDLPVIVGCLKLIRLSERLSYMFRRLSCRLSGSLSWPLAQLEGSDANKHTRKARYFHAAYELICLSVHLSLHFGSAVDSPVVCCLKLIRLSERLSYMSRRLSWPFAQQGGSDADKHTPRPGSPTLLMN